MEKTTSPNSKLCLTEHSSPDTKFPKRSISLAEVRARRKLVELNAQLLSNRLNVLQQEKNRLGKTITDTKEKAFEIYQRRLEKEKSKVLYVLLAAIHTHNL